MREPGGTVCASECFVDTGSAQCCGMREGGRRKRGREVGASYPLWIESAFVAMSWSRVSDVSGSCEAEYTTRNSRRDGGGGSGSGRRGKP